MTASDFISIVIKEWHEHGNSYKGEVPDIDRDELIREAKRAGFELDFCVFETKETIWLTPIGRHY